MVIVRCSILCKFGLELNITRHFGAFESHIILYFAGAEKWPHAIYEMLHYDLNILWIWVLSIFYGLSLINRVQNKYSY